MEPEQLHQKIIAAARKLPSDDSVPYCFEKRILSAVSRRKAQPSDWLARALVKPALLCIGVMVLTAGWTFVGHPASGDDPPELENAIWAPFDSLADAA